MGPEGPGFCDATRRCGDPHPSRGIPSVSKARLKSLSTTQPRLKILIVIVGPFIFAHLSHSPGSAQSEPRFAGDPLLLGAGARALGMGNAFVPVSDDATAVYWNPAGLAGLSRSEAQVQHAERFGGTVNHDVITLARPSRIGGFGIGLLRLGVDGVRLTTLEDPSQPLGPENRPIVSREVGTSDYNLHLAYGRAARPNLYLGAALKLIWRNLAAGNGSGYGLDVGVLYVPVPALTLGASIRNLTRTRITFDSATTDRIQPSIIIGGAYTKGSRALRGRLIFAGSVHMFEEESGLEDLESVQLGAEYIYRERLAFRIGAKGNHFTAGTGIYLYSSLAFDLAFVENSQLDNTYQISASFFF